MVDAGTQPVYVLADEDLGRGVLDICDLKEEKEKWCQKGDGGGGGIIEKHVWKRGEEERRVCGEWKREEGGGKQLTYAFSQSSVVWGMEGEEGRARAVEAARRKVKRRVWKGIIVTGVSYS
jgi:hypothetical protein